MRSAFSTFFMFITTLFTATNRLATTVDNYAKWAEAESAAFEAEAAIERTTRITKLTRAQAIELAPVKAAKA